MLRVTSPRRHRARGIACALLAGALALTGCALSVPSDPNDTFEKVSGGTIRVGISVDPPLTEVSDTGPSGPMIDLAAGFARQINATPEWSVQSEETLVKQLESGHIDLAVGSFTDQTPWSDRVGMTRGYTTIPGSDSEAKVMLVPLGENKLLTELEMFLDEEVGP